MVHIQATNNTIDSFVRRVCAPLFCHARFLNDGHNESTTSATVTFIKFECHVYAVTCHHVLSIFFKAAVKRKDLLVPSIHSGHNVHQFGFTGSNGLYRWTFQSCREFPTGREVDAPDAIAAIDRKNADKPDIAIADITDDWLSLSKLRNADVIDLDSWQEPDWNIVQNVWMAYGFPDNHKQRKGNMVVAPMPRVTAELASAPSNEKTSYTLCSTLDVNHGWGFSGLSGGPVFAAHIDKDQYAFVGITYEGAPSTKELQKNADSFIGENDIILKGYHVTPCLFREWLALQKYEAKFT